MMSKIAFLPKGIFLLSKLLLTAPRYLFSGILKEKRTAEVSINDPSSLKFLLEFFKKNEEFKLSTLLDIFVVDYLSKKKRFQLNYILVSVNYSYRLRIKLNIAENTVIPSVSSVFPSANWLERESWDLYGIFFSEHPDLRRILTDYGFSGFPMRKDFPIAGYTQVRYDDDTKKIILEPLKISQEFRNFIFVNPWQNTQNRKK